MMLEFLVRKCTISARQLAEKCKHVTKFTRTHLQRVAFSGKLQLIWTLNSWGGFLHDCCDIAEPSD